MSLLRKEGLGVIAYTWTEEEEGAEVNAYFVEGVYPMPNDAVAFATTMAGKLNQDMPEREAQTHVDTPPTEQADTEHALDVENKPEERAVP